MLPEALRTCGSRSFSLPKSPHHHSRTLGAKLASHVNENLSSDRLIVCSVSDINSGLAGPADGWNPGDHSLLEGELGDDTKNRCEADLKVA